MEILSLSGDEATSRIQEAVAFSRNMTIALEESKAIASETP